MINDFTYPIRGLPFLLLPSPPPSLTYQKPLARGKSGFSWTPGFCPNPLGCWWNELCDQVETRPDKGSVKTMGIPQKKSLSLETNVTIPWTINGYQGDNRWTWLNTLLTDARSPISGKSAHSLITIRRSSMNDGWLEGWPIIFKRTCFRKRLVIFWNNSFHEPIESFDKWNCAYKGYFVK